MIAAASTAPAHGPRARRAWLDTPAPQFALCVVFALVIRLFALGDPVYHIDENWYLLVGERLNAGDRLYVDIWDRKPPGLFLIFRLAAASADPLLAYQLAAGLCAALTAFLILRMARQIGSPGAGVVMAISYLTLTAQLGGAGGQSPVFYNSLIAGAALLVGFSRKDAPVGRREAFAMLLAGSAIVVKPTAAFEAIFLGLWVVYRLYRQGAGWPVLLRRTVVLALLGLAPALSIAAYYWVAGDFDAFWQAVVASSLDKEGQIADPERWNRLRIVFMVLLFPLGAAAISLLTVRREQFLARRLFLAGWLAAAFVGLFSVPNFYEHYLLPLLVPLVILGSPFIAQSGLLTLLGLLGALSPLLEAKPWDFSRTSDHVASYARLVEAVRQAGGSQGLLVYDGPASLYADAGIAPPSPIAFPNHWWDRFERDVSGLNTAGEMRRVLGGRPQVVVMGREVSQTVTNFETREPLAAYVRTCRVVASVELAGWTPTDMLDVYGDCRKDGARRLFRGRGLPLPPPPWRWR